MQMIFGQYSPGYSELLYAIFMDAESVLYKVTVSWKATKETAHLPVIAQKFEVRKIDFGDGPVIEKEALIKAAEEFKEATYSWVYPDLINRVSCAELASKNPYATALGRVRKLGGWAIINHDFLSKLGDDWGTCADVMGSLLNSKAGVI
ncbi:MAG: hypothetical protein CTY12_02135 [Methylotenera sp.]|nr:MAG: hypothetical protein CTY12_02135 [Methylotenera sp.]